MAILNTKKAMPPQMLLDYFEICSTDKEFRDFFMATFNSKSIIKYNDRNEINSFFINRER